MLLTVCLDHLWTEGICINSSIFIYSLVNITIRWGFFHFCSQSFPRLSWLVTVKQSRREKSEDRRSSHLLPNAVIHDLSMEPNGRKTKAAVHGTKQSAGKVREKMWEQLQCVTWRRKHEKWIIMYLLEENNCSHPLHLGTIQLTVPNQALRLISSLKKQPFRSCWLRS